ncbi:MAG: HDOD domain-containing protein [Planctomycetota bacterium]|nr:HDOD domain-containing protein [Planctomycetota bacterium]
MDNLKEQLKHIEQLEANVGVLAKITDLFSHDEVSSDEIEAILATDVALTASVLRVANSAARGGSVQVKSLRDAITRTGAKDIRRLVVAHSGSSAVGSDLEAYGISRDEAWRAAVAGAIAAEGMARRRGFSDPGMAFLAGLLRDCGKLAMEQIVGKVELGDAIRSKSPTDDEAVWEQEHFGFDHCEAGSELAMLWGLPDELAEAIRDHHHPSSREPQQLVDLVHCADAVCLMMGIGVGLDGLAYEMDKEACQRIDFELSELEMIGDDLRNGMDELVNVANGDENND